MTVQERMSANDWETLQRAPIRAVAVVMDVMEHKVSAPAVEALTDGILECAAGGEGLAQEVCMSIVAAFQEAAARGEQPELVTSGLTGGVQSAYAGLAEARQLLDREAPADDALKFKLAVNQIATRAAHTYGGGFLGRTKKHSDEAVQAVRSQLGLGTE